MRTDRQLFRADRQTVVPCGRTDGHYEAKSFFPKLEEFNRNSFSAKSKYIYDIGSSTGDSDGRGSQGDSLTHSNNTII